MVVALCLEHEIPSLEPKWDTICYLFVLSQTFQWACVLGIKTLHPLHFSFALQFQQDYYCCLFYQVWQTCQWLGFRAVCPGILAYCPLEQKKKIEQMFLPLCVMPHPPVLFVGSAVRGWIVILCCCWVARGKNRFMNLDHQCRLPSHVSMRSRSKVTKVHLRQSIQFALNATTELPFLSNTLGLSYLHSRVWVAAAAGVDQLH